MPFQDQILEYLSDPDYRPLKAGSLAKHLKIKKRDLPKFREAIDRLITDGRVTENQKGRLRLREAAGEIAGIFKRISTGGGFVVPHGTVPGFRGGDIFVSPEDVRDAHTGDEVLVRLSRRRRSGNRRCGQIVSILERATNTFVGTYFEEGDEGFVRVDGKTFTDPVYVGDPGAKGAIPDDKVVIEMLRFPSHLRPGEAVLTKVLGPRGEPGVDTETIIHEFGLPVEFSQDASTKPTAQADRFDETVLGDRLDLTKEIIVTIDPKDARDFDDAISLKRTRDGHWHLGVHIADVSHFVEEGSLLDAEARHRGTSVYLPRRVIPMLPEVISNGLASLQQGKLRIHEIGVDRVHCRGHSRPYGVRELGDPSQPPVRLRRGHADHQRPGAVSRAGQRESSAASGEHAHARNDASQPPIRRGALNSICRRSKSTSIRTAKSPAAHESVHDESHQIIEEFMLAANVAVAVELSDRGLPFLRRVHGDPDYLKLKAFADFARRSGFRWSNSKAGRLSRT